VDDGPSSDATEEEPEPELSWLQRKARDARNVARNLVIVVFGVLTPWAIYNAYLWLNLRSGLFRPVVSLNDPRAWLIVGTQSSGTTQTYENLVKLGIEVFHESSDAQESFSRDGTVSWVHGIRYFKHTKVNLDKLCDSPKVRILHSTQFEASAKCSYRELWNDCWAEHCREVFTKQYGCYPNCEHPPEFGSVMLQVRDPLRTAASLIVKYCTDVDDGSLPHPMKLAVLESFMPDIKWAEMQGGCKEVFGTYWVEYNRRILESLKNDPRFSWFQIESTAPCEIARRAGFLEPDELAQSDSLVHRGSRLRARRACEVADSSESPLIFLQEERTSFGSANRGNRVLELTWEDFDPMPELKTRMQELARHFDYRV